jgi:hypothetical protein
MAGILLRCCYPNKDECGFRCRFFNPLDECSKNDFCEWQCDLNLKNERKRFMSLKIREEAQS